MEIISVSVGVIGLSLFGLYVYKYYSLQNTIEKVNHTESLYYNSPNMICTITIDGVIEDANHLFLHETGLSLDDAPSFYSLFVQAEEIERKIQASFNEEEVTYYQSIYNRNDEIVTVSVTHIPSLETKKSKRIMVVLQDVTELQRSKETAYQKMYMKSTILSTISEGLLVHDVDGNVTLINQRAGELLGVSNEKLYSLNPFIEQKQLQFIDEQGREVTKSQLPGIRAFQEDVTYENQVLGLVNQSGSPSPKWLMFNASPYYLYGEKKGVLLTFSDITEERERSIKLKEANEHLQIAIEEENKASQAKSEFITRMSHELRTPLNSIIGYSELILELQDESQPSIDIKRVEKIHRAGGHLLHLINDLLNLSKTEMEQLDYNKESINLYRVTKRAIEIVQPLSEKHMITIQFIHNHYEGSEVVGDALLVRQVLVNLLTNAIKYNKEEGKVTISIDQEDEYATIYIKDEGIGIQEEYVSQIFDSFYRVPSTEASGSGIGLSIVKQLIEKMGGTCGVKTKVNEGSTFWVSLPTKHESIRE
ncbi:sensor histidine kinase [Pontibacillus yanchengensis]|uniref:histidine kinase n=1 Tax=Pontibacillus yanchengensis Y32 TaxID=1385514 RepID=A0A0A2TZ48_9BACI|nr:PAS domain-containing sensor histidine kinase [Pontibacillus yanchengensis]KGP74545.1 signal transduction protein, sensor protein and response regulator domains [Pontibacillus yanchengensis Y32]